MLMGKDRRQYMTEKGCVLMLNMKLFGIALIMVSASAIGCIFGERAKKEIKIFESLNRCLMLFEAEIRYSGTPIRDICGRIAGCRELWSDFFARIADGLGENTANTDVGRIWEDAAAYSGISSGLTDEDIRELIRFGSELGGGDRESELGRINLYMDYIRNRLSYLYENINDKVRLCRLLGVTAGVFITILIV